MLYYFLAQSAECLLSLSLLLSIMRKERVCMVHLGLKNNTPWKFESLQKLYCSKRPLSKGKIKNLSYSKEKMKLPYSQQGGLYETINF